MGPGLTHSTLCSTPKAYPLFVVLMETVSHVAKPSPNGLLQVEWGSWEVSIRAPRALLWLHGGFLLGVGCCWLHARCREGKGGEEGKGAFWQVGMGLGSRRHRGSSSVVSYLLGNWGCCCSLKGVFPDRAFLSALSLAGGLRS